ncbi:uncharacterized protein LOC128884145 isoform X2 [Hylaeus volcanicus]|uniref:uncharacterized protein LOC128884145 isoform X2 n=1 Tax=Hylaeus volcanicus TaxID=313075 RepID=UPI0023B7FB0F|nr:uncharacterized protein LOC128884145 isoform X2 [Hylaeus volcanicus]
MCFPLPRNILILDVDGLFWDTNALMIALASSVFHLKLNGTDICQNLSLMSLEKISNVFIELQREGKFDLDMSKKLSQKALEYGHLCRPYFGAITAYKCFKDVFQNDILFATCKPEITQPLIKQLVNTYETMSCNVECLELCNETTLGVANSPLYFFTTKMDSFCALRQKNQNKNASFALDALSLFFVTKQLSFVHLCLDYLPVKSQVPLSKIVLGTKKTFTENTALVYSYQDFLKIKDPIKIQTCLCQSIEDLNMESFLAEYLGHPYNKILPLYQYRTKVCPMELERSPRCAEAHFWSMTHLLEHSLLFDGIVIKGFGRGGKQLGIPTANLSVNQSVDGESLPFPGVYFGFSALFDNGHFKAPKTSMLIYDTILSAGYNPYYNNDRLVVEPHLFHTFKNDFHSVRLRLVVIGIVRPESTFSCFEHLVQAIQLDCKVVRQTLIRLHKTKASLLLYNKKRLHQQLHCD